MPGIHRIVLTEDAVADLEGIALFIRQYSPQNAAAVAQTVLNAIDSLASMPTRFKHVAKSRKRGTPVHALTLRPFVIYYRVEPAPATVYILSVRHGGRRKPRGFK